MALVQENPMNNQITEMLASAGIDLSTCRTVKDIPFLVVRAGKPAVGLWKSLASPLQQAGHWPIICGDAEEYDRIEEQISDQDEDVREILAHVPAGVSAAAAHAAERAAQRQRMLEHFRADPKHQELLKFFENTGEEEGSCSNESPDYTTWSSRGKPPEVRVQSAFGYDRDPYRSVLLAIVPAANAADSPAYLNFGGFNACPSTPIHVAHLREWKQRFGAVPIAITDAVIEMFLASPVQSKEDAWSLARDFYAYCPDIVDQGTGTVNRLANEIWKSPQWYFWWD